MQIAESDGEDDGCAEVITPDVLLVPGTEVDHVGAHPTVLGVDWGHSDQHAGKQVAHY